VDLRTVIKGELDERRWSQRDLAINSSVSPSTISRYLSEEQDDLTVAQLVAIASAFGKMAGDWLGHSERDPAMAPLEGIAEELHGTPIAEREEMIKLLREHVRVMKKWRREGSKVRPSVTTSGGNSDESQVGREVRVKRRQ